MKKFLIIFSVLGWIVYAGAESVEWPVPGAPYRLLASRETNSPWPATTGYLEFCPVGLDPSNIAARVFRAGGTETVCQVLWAAAGEPVKLLIDTTGAGTSYYVYPMAAAATTNPAWQAEAGVMLETRVKADGPAESWEQVQQLWDKSGPILGRSMLPMIFLGMHPHGPPANFIARYLGTFTVDRPGDYQIATVSQGPSFCRIDGAPAAQWPGRHGVGEGLHGEHHGTLELTAGRHSIAYYHVHTAGDPVAEVAWRKLDTNRFEVMPAAVFTPLACFRVLAAQTPLRQPAAYFDWEITGQATVSNLAVVSVAFRALPPETGKHACQWTFDDGTTSDLQSFQHVFPRPGYRTVRLEVYRDRVCITGVTQKINVHPLWTQREDRPEKLLAGQRAELMSRRLETMPAADLAQLTLFADAIEDRPWLNQLGQACLRRQSELVKSYPQALFRLGFHYQRPESLDDAAAETAFRALLGPAPTDAALAESARLHLVELLVKLGRNPDEARALLDHIAIGLLEPGDQRLKQLVEGDLELARGDADKARLIYLTAGATARGDSLLAALRQRAAIESAKQFIQAREYDSAAELIEKMEWDNPLFRLSAETGLILIEAGMGRGAYRAALARCGRLLNVPDLPAGQRAELMLQLVAITVALDDQDAARRAFDKLLTEYPYSEAAARARDKFSHLHHIRETPAK